jgi:signal transduction histidine kinase
MTATRTRIPRATDEAESRVAVMPARVGAALAIGLMMGTLVLLRVTWSDQVTPLSVSRVSDVVLVIAFLGYSLVGALIVSRLPQNRVGWIFLASGLMFQLWAFSYWYAMYGLVARPGTLPIARLMAWIFQWTMIVGIGLAFTFLLLVFPTGRLPSSRWRPVAWFAAVAVLVAGITWATNPGPLDPFGEVTNPVGIAAVGRLDLTGVGWVLTVLAVVASAVSLIVRYLRSAGVERRQIQWFAYAAALMGLTLVMTSIASESEWGPVGMIANVLFPLALVALPAAGAVAILKHDLYDLDIVVSRTITFGILTALITGTYVAVVVGFGALVGTAGEPNLALSVLATIIVATTFQPARTRVQRLANRLVYGRRSTPYEVLAGFSKRAAAAQHDDEMLERIPRLIVEGTGASRATLWTASGEGLRPTATWPEQQNLTGAIPVTADVRWSDAEADYSLPVEHDGELLGGLSLVASHGEAITPIEQELVQNLARGLGLAFRNARLTDDLRDQVTQLAASRDRILTAADDARRNLERDLDMGPQQELVAVKVKLGVVKSRPDVANAPKTLKVLDRLEEEVGKAIESVRDFARGVYPPLLEAEGLAQAISSEADKAALPVTVGASGVGRYPREMEAAVFFSILEALQNAAKYADAGSATVKLSDDGDRLNFEVADDGRGFDPASVTEGTGIYSMTDRLDAAGGTLTIDSAPGRGTVVTGSVPVSARRPANAGVPPD